MAPHRLLNWEFLESLMLGVSKKIRRSNLIYEKIFEKH